MPTGEYIDIYVLSTDRSADTIQKFLNTFMPDYREMAEEYEVPQYSEHPRIVFTKDRKLMEHCAANPNEKHTIYWFNNRDDEPRTAMVFYMNDNHVILGLAIDDKSSFKRYLESLKDFCGSEFTCALVETPAPNNSEEFIKLCGSL